MFVFYLFILFFSATSFCMHNCPTSLAATATANDASQTVHTTISLVDLASTTYLKGLLHNVRHDGLRKTIARYNKDKKRLPIELEFFLKAKAQNMHQGTDKPLSQGFPLAVFAETENQKLFCFNTLGFFQNPEGFTDQPNVKGTTYIPTQALIERFRNQGSFSRYSDIIDAAHHAIISNHARVFSYLVKQLGLLYRESKPTKHFPNYSLEYVVLNKYRVDQEEKTSRFSNFLRNSLELAQFFGRKSIQQEIIFLLKKDFLEPEVPLSSPTPLTKILYGIKNSNKSKAQWHEKFSTHLNKKPQDLFTMLIAGVVFNRPEIFELALQAAPAESFRQQSFMGKMVEQIISAYLHPRSRVAFFRSLAEFNGGSALNQAYGEVVDHCALLTTEELLEIIPKIDGTVINLSYNNKTMLGRLCNGDRSLEEIKALIASNPSFDPLQQFDALHTAVENNQSELVAFLTQLGVPAAQVTVGDAPVWPFDYAKTDDMRELLIRKGCCSLKEPSLFTFIGSLFNEIEISSSDEIKRNKAIERVVQVLGWFPQRLLIKQRDANNTQELFPCTLMRYTINNSAGKNILNKLYQSANPFPFRCTFNDDSSFLQLMINRDQLDLALTHIRYLQKKQLLTLDFVNNADVQGNTALHNVLDKAIAHDCFDNRNGYKKSVKIASLLASVGSSLTKKNKAGKAPLDLILPIQSKLKEQIIASSKAGQESLIARAARKLGKRKRHLQSAKEAPATKISRTYE